MYSSNCNRNNIYVQRMTLLANILYNLLTFFNIVYTVIKILLFILTDFRVYGLFTLKKSRQLNIF